MPDAMGKGDLKLRSQIKKLVRVRLTVELDVYVPHYFSKKEIEQDEDLHLYIEDALELGGGDLVRIKYVETLDEAPCTK